jgi:hypothetical protein
MDKDAVSRVLKIITEDILDGKRNYNSYEGLMNIACLFGYMLVIVA